MKAKPAISSTTLPYKCVGGALPLALAIALIVPDQTDRGCGYFRSRIADRPRCCGRILWLLGCNSSICQLLFIVYLFFSLFLFLFILLCLLLLISLSLSFVLLLASLSHIVACSVNIACRGLRSSLFAIFPYNSGNRIPLRIFSLLLNRCAALHCFFGDEVVPVY